MNNLSQLQKLLAELISAADEVFKSGEQLPDEFWNELADEIEATQARIQEMQMLPHPEPKLPPPVAPPPPKTPAVGLSQAMPSSNVESFSYNPKTQDLYVRFLGDFPNKQGPLYRYGGVPLETYKSFRKGDADATTEGSNDWGSWHVGKNPSMGAAVNQMLKAGGFPYERVGPSAL